MDDFKNFIKNKRKKLGYSQNQLAKLIGITQSYFNGIERGEVKNPPSEAVLDKISEALQLTEEESKNMKYMAALERTPEIIRRELYDIEKKLKFLENNRQEKNTPPLSEYKIPVYERISAGPGAINYGEIEDFLTIPDFNPRGEVFAINVMGDSMEPTIKNSAVIIVKKNVEVKNGEIGAFLMNDEAYVKRLKVTESYVALISDNPNYAPIYIGPGEELYTVGKVIKVINDI
jgi:SOS-response transcriptional repressor LexA